MRIVVIGAYGYTGRLIAEDLARNGYSFAAAGKRKEKLVELIDVYPAIRKIEIVDLTVEADCNHLLANYDFFINCAGPFTEESALFLKGVASNHAKTYLDITGELGFVRDSYEQYNELAKVNQSSIFHACAFESFLAGLGFQLLKRDLPAPISAKTYYQFSRSRPSPGTKITMKMSNLRTLHFLNEGKWETISDANKQFYQLEGNTVTAVPYPLPEIAFFSWNEQLQTAGSYLLLAPEDALFSGQKKEADINLLETLESLKERKGKGPDAEERAAQRADLFVELEDKNGKQSRLHLKGNDMYALTAKCILLLVNKLDAIAEQPFGVVSPAELFLGKEESTLKKLGVTQL